MSQQNKAGFKAQSAAILPNNTNEDIAPIDLRTMDIDTADSVAFLNDVASITGDWTFSVVVKGITPVADEDLATKKYVDDNAGVGAGDVTGPVSSIDNNIVVFDGATGKVIKNGTGVSVSQTGDFSSVGNIEFSTATKTIGNIQNGNLLDKSISQTVDGGWTFSDNITTIAPVADLHAATKKYVDDNIGGGDVSVSGTPSNNQLAIWTNSNTIEGDSNLTWDGATFSIGGALSLNSLVVDNIVLDGNDISTSSGDLTLNPSGDFLIQSGNASFVGEVFIITTGAASKLSIGDDVTDANASITTKAARTGNDNNILQLVGNNFGTQVANIRYKRGTQNDEGYIDFRTKVTGQSISTSLTIAPSGDSTFTGDVTADDFILSSDVRLKEDIEQLGYGYIKFKRKGDERVHIGTTAQHAKELYPETVTEDKDGYMKVSYFDFLCAEVARLSKELDEIKNVST